MMKKHLIQLLMVAICLYIPTTSIAQKSKYKINLWVHVIDEFTEIGISGTHLYLMNADSTVIDSAIVSDRYPTGNALRTNHNFIVPFLRKDYIIKATHPLYAPVCVNCEVKPRARMNFVDAPLIRMLKVRKAMERKLDEVVVKATKVKMVYKGDTLIYNADAFNMPEGSMLGNLIRQMPGAKIDPYGVITINGRKVDYLTLNGKKLFNNDNKVLLDNLPYYTVKNLKVFEEVKETDLAVGNLNREKDYIMDVVLKKEYDIKSFGHASAGYGTENRYAGRVFAALNSNSISGVAYGNINNVNQTELPGNNGWDTGFTPPRDVTRTKQVGVSGQVESPNAAWGDHFGASGNWTDTYGDTQQTQETYLSSGNIVKKSLSDSRQQNMKGNLWNRFSLRQPSYMWANTNATYYKQDIRSGSLNATLNGMPEFHSMTALFDSIRSPFLNPADRLYKMLTNSSEYGTDNNRNYWSLSQTAQVSQHLSWGDYIEFTAMLDHNHTDSNKDEWQNIHYYENSLQKEDYKAKEEFTNNETQGSIGGKYVFRFLNGLMLHLSYYYHQIYREWEKDRTRDGADDNSLRYTSSISRHFPGISLEKKWERWFISTGFSMCFDQEKLHNRRAVSDTVMRPSFIDVMPTLNLIWQNRTDRFTFNTRLNTTNKPLNAQLDETLDTSNPLMFTQGNTDLKKEQTLAWSTSYSHTFPKYDFTMNMGVNGSFVFDQITTASIYNETTGIYTLTPHNVNGNRYVQGYVSAGRALNKNRSLYMQNDVKYTYSRMSDLTGTASEGLSMNKVNMHNLYEGLKLTWQLKQVRVMALGNFNWRRTRSKGYDNRNTDTYEYSYGVTANGELPWKLQLAGELIMYSHRGYFSSAMNTDDFIGNVSLSRSFLKNKLNCQLIAYDIFHQCTSTNYNVSAQGWTETFYNCIPRYMMLTLTYRFGNFNK